MGRFFKSICDALSGIVSGRSHTLADKAAPDRAIQDITELSRTTARYQATQEMWGSVVDTMSSLFFIRDPNDEFRYVLCNRAFADFLGMTREDIIGRTDAELARAPHYIDMMTGESPNALKPGRSEPCAIEVIDGNGKKHVFRGSIMPVSGADGRTLLAGCFSDETQLVTLQKKTADAVADFRATLNSIGDGVLVVDTRGRVTLTNPVAESVFGLTSGEMYGKPHEGLFRILAEDDDRPIESPVARAIATGETVWRTEHVVEIPATDRRYHVSSNAAPIRNEKGVITGAILVFRDVTEEQRKRIELETALASLETAAEMAKLAVFRLDYKTREISGTRVLSDFWPIQDGKASHFDLFVLPEDLAGVNAKYLEVVMGDASRATFQYRVFKEGRMRYYRVFIRRTPSVPHELNGVIQDMTEITESLRKRDESRALWELVVNNIPIMLYIKDASDFFRYRLSNRKFNEFVGCASDQVIGHTDKELFTHGEDVALFAKNDESVMQAGASREFCGSVRNNHGEKRNIHTMKIPCSDAENRSLLLGLSYDTTDVQLLAATRAIIVSSFEQLFRTNDMTAAVYAVLKRTAEYIEASRAFVYYPDREKKNIHCFVELVPEGETAIFDRDFSYEGREDEPWFQWLVSGADQYTCDFENENECRHAGKIVPHIVSFLRQCDIRSLHMNYISMDGKPGGAVGFIFEHMGMRKLSAVEEELLSTTAHMIELAIRRKQEGDEREKALEQARSADRAKSVFLATMSHEIRTPLNAVIGFAELLNSTNSTLSESDRHDYLAGISSSGNALLALINDVLDLSKLEAGQMLFKLAPTPFQEVLSETKSVFSRRCDAKGLRFLVEIANDFPVLWIDRLRIGQILFNLVGNAVKFTDTGSVTVRIEFTPEANEEGTLVIHVVDTGIGISKNDQRDLFGMFVQAKSITGTRAASSGTGLGLAICRRMVEQMNGSIGLVSEPGKGSDFFVTLHKIRYRNETREQRLDAVRTTTSRMRLVPVSILLVDDVALNLKVAAAILRNIGMNVTPVSNCDEALKTLETRYFDCIITDLWMPGKSGIDLAALVRHGGAHPKTRIVALTADTEYRDKIDISLFDAVLTKPITSAKFCQLFASMIAEES